MRLLLIGAVLLTATAACGSGAPEPAAPQGPPVRELRIGLSEYRLQLSAGAVLPGAITIAVTNVGSAGHDVRLVQGDRTVGATAVLAPGAREVLEVEVAPGTMISLDCTIPGHAEAGMTGMLAVDGG